jgi:hypothetical protein
MSLDLEKTKQSVAAWQLQCEKMTEKRHYDQHQMKEQKKIVNEESENWRRTEFGSLKNNRKQKSRPHK